MVVLHDTTHTLPLGVITLSVSAVGKQVPSDRALDTY